MLLSSVPHSVRSFYCTLHCACERSPTVCPLLFGSLHRHLAVEICTEQRVQLEQQPNSSECVAVIQREIHTVFKHQNKWYAVTGSQSPITTRLRQSFYQPDFYLVRIIMTYAFDICSVTLWCDIAIACCLCPGHRGSCFSLIVVLRTSAPPFSLRMALSGLELLWRSLFSVSLYKAVFWLTCRHRKLRSAAQGMWSLHFFFSLHLW